MRYLLPMASERKVTTCGRGEAYHYMSVSGNCSKNPLDCRATVGDIEPSNAWNIQTTKNLSGKQVHIIKKDDLQGKALGQVLNIVSMNPENIVAGIHEPDQQWQIIVRQVLDDRFMGVIKNNLSGNILLPPTAATDEDVENEVITGPRYDPNVHLIDEDDPGPWVWVFDKKE